MRKVICSLALFAAVGVLVASISPLAPAQQQDKKDVKKSSKKDTKPDDKKSDTPEASSTVEVYQGKDGWRFRILGPDGKSVAIGLQGYAKKQDCIAAVDVLKTTITKAKLIEVKKDR